MKQIKGIWFPDSDTHFEGMIDDEGNYQKMQFDTALKYIKPENRGLFIDVGAHVGLWSRMAAKSGFSKILSFEPDNQNLECYKKNLDSVSESKKGGFGAKWHNFGLSDKFEEVLILKERSDNSGSVIAISAKCDKCHNVISGEKAVLRVFDLIYNDDNISTDLKGKILIKIDVQGYEAKVVRGMTNFIKEYKPIIIVEQWLNGKEDLEATHYCQLLGMKILERVEKEVILGWENKL